MNRKWNVLRVLVALATLCAVAGLITSTDADAHVRGLGTKPQGAWYELARLPHSGSAIDFTDPDHGWVGTWDGRLLRTADGGRTWSSFNLTPSAGARSVVRTIVATPHGCWVGGGWYDDVETEHPFAGFYDERDGSWTMHELEPDGEVWALALAGQTLWIGGSQAGHPSAGGFLISTGAAGARGAAGAAWTRRDLPREVGCITFLDNHRGWVGTGGGAIYRTTDAGQSWQAAWPSGFDPHDLEYRRGITAISFISATRGWAICEASGDDLDLIETSDGGRSWSYKPSDFYGEGWVFDCVFVSATQGFIAKDGDSGLMGLLQTGDGGTNWTTAFGRPEEWVWSLDFVNPRCGFAVATLTEPVGNQWLPYSAVLRYEAP